MKKSLKNNNMNGGFPPLVLKNNEKGNNKERLMASNINNNINIYQILQTKSNKNILDNFQEHKETDDLEIITNL